MFFVNYFDGFMGFFDVKGKGILFTCFFFFLRKIFSGEICKFIVLSWIGWF